MVGCRAGVCLKVFQRNMLPKKKNCTGTNDKFLNYPVTLYSNFLDFYFIPCLPGLPFLVCQDCFEMSARTSTKISTKKKRGKSGLIAGAPKKIHRERKYLSEKNIEKKT